MTTHPPTVLGHIIPLAEDGKAPAEDAAAQRPYPTKNSVKMHPRPGNDFYFALTPNS